MTCRTKARQQQKNRGVTCGSYHQRLIPRLIHHIHRRQLQRRPPHRIHERPVRPLLHAHERHLGLESHVPRPFRQDDPHLHFPVADALAHLRALEEGDLQHVSALGVAQLAEERLEIGVPPDAETVLPAAENGIPRFQLQQGFLPAAAEARGGDVADVVGEVRVQTPDLQGYLQLPQRGGGWVVILRRGPLHAAEVLPQAGAEVGEPVAFLGREVAAPVRDFDVALEAGGVDERFREFVPHARFLPRSCRHDFVVRAIGEGAALAVRVPADDVRDVGGGEFELRFLFQGRVGGRGVGAEGVEEVLSFLLADFLGEGGEGGEDVVGYGEGELGFGREGSGEGGEEELGRARMALVVMMMIMISCSVGLGERTDLLGSYSTTSALKAGPGFFLSLTSRPPTLSMTSALKGM